MHSHKIYICSEHHRDRDRIDIGINLDDMKRNVMGFYSASGIAQEDLEWRFQSHLQQWELFRKSYNAILCSIEEIKLDFEEKPGLAPTQVAEETQDYVLGTYVDRLARRGYKVYK